MSKSLSPAERNYNIFDKELLAIIKAFKEWCHLLEGTEIPVLLITNHKNLEYFMTSKVLTKQQNRWAVFLSEFNFQIKYRASGLNGKEDALSQQSNYDLEGGVVPQKPLLPPHLFISLAEEEPQGMASTTGTWQAIKDQTQEDNYVTAIWVFLSNQPEKAPVSVQKEFGDWQIRNDMLYCKGKIYAPSNNRIKRQILELHHDNKAARHMGQVKTLEMVKQQYWWPSMKAYVNKYISSCNLCQQSKPINQCPLGELQPLELPSKPWQHISIDMIVKLPLSKGLDSILVVVDTLTKMAHFIPCTERTTSPKLAELFMEHCWKLHGTPETIVSDCGPTFASKFMRELYQALNIQPRLSMAYHPETDRQTERINQMVEAFICTYCAFRQHDCTLLLPFAEFAYNNLFHSSIGMTPFFANTACHPSIEGTPVEDGSVPEAAAHEQRIQDNLEEAKASLTLSKEWDKEYVDRRRQEDPFILGNKLWLSHNHITTNRPFIELSHKCLGPFTILEAVGKNAYKLDLPPSMTMHLVINVSHLAKYKEDKIEGCHVKPPPPIKMPEGEEEYKVESIQSSKVEKGVLKYFVKWKGYTAEHNSWEPLENLGNASELINKFHKEHPEAIEEVPKVTRKCRHEETKEDLTANNKEDYPIWHSKCIEEAAGIQIPHQKVFTFIPPVLKPLPTLASPTMPCLPSLPTPASSASITTSTHAWPPSSGHLRLYLWPRMVDTGTWASNNIFTLLLVHAPTTAAPPPPRSFVGFPLVQWNLWIALTAQDIHDAWEIMDALRCVQLGLQDPFEVINLTNGPGHQEPVINLMEDDEEDVWKVLGRQRTHLC